MESPPRPSGKGKLRNKIFLFMALIGIVPLAAAAVLTDYVVTNSHRDDVAKLEAAVLTEKSAEIQDFIDQDILGQTRIVVPYNATNGVATSAEEYALTNTISILPFIQSESFIDLSGQEQVHVDRSHLDGYPSSSFQDFSASPAFQAAKAGNYYLGPIAYINNVPAITFASPEKDNNGETLGVVYGSATLGDIQAIVASTTIGNTGYIYLVDQNGNLIAGGSAFADTDAIMPGSPAVAKFAIVQSVLAGNSLLTAQAQTTYENISGTQVVGAGEPMQEYGNERWALIAEWPTSEANAVVGALLWRDIIILIIVFIFIVLLSVLLSMLIVRPVKKLEGATARVAQGKFNEGVSITTGDELEELGDSFNTMMMGLKELEQLKDEFVFIAAHELRTPVAAMKGYLSLILDGSTGAITDQTKVFIEKVLASNERLIQLVNDLLEVARSQAGRLTIKVTPIDLVTPIASTLDELKSLADEKSVTLKYDAALAGAPGTAPTPLPKVLGDADRVKEVVINLVGNAIKYMGGSGTITITHELIKENGASVPGAPGVAMLATNITDTGLGISKEAQAKLFGKFYRVQSEKTRDITGTGLGLFIVKEIIEKMNGTISVVSEEGKGSTFTFSLPIAS